MPGTQIFEILFSTEMSSSQSLVYLLALSWRAETDDCSMQHIEDLLHLGVIRVWEGGVEGWGVVLCITIIASPAGCLLDDVLSVLCQPFCLVLL